jgi:hypothetical protein
VNNPASAEGFTVIFSKARDEKKSHGTAAGSGAIQRNDIPSKPEENNYQNPMTVRKCLSLSYELKRLEFEHCVRNSSFINTLYIWMPAFCIFEFALYAINDIPITYKEILI